MVLVNGKNIKIYELDTVHSVIVRIASEMRTLSKYLHFPNGVPEVFDDSTDVEVVDTLGMIKNNAKNSTKFMKFYNENKELFSAKLDVEHDILYVWLAYNTKLESLEKTSRIVLSQAARPLIENGFFEDENRFRRFWDDDRAATNRRLERAVNNTRDENTDNITLYKSFDEIDDGYGYIGHTADSSEFITERTSLQFRLNMEDISLLELFNNIVLTEGVPFASVRSYYKILKDFVPVEEWAVTSDDEILFKIGEKEISNDKTKDFTNVNVAFNEHNELVVKMKLRTERGFLSRDQFFDRFLNLFPGMGKLQYDNVSETEVIGLFYYPMERLDTYVFSDLIVNNKLFSALIDIDESSKATKKMSEFRQPWLHLHFNHPATGHITAAITQRQVDRRHKEMNGQNSDFFPNGSPYIRVRVRGRNLESIKNFQEIFSKLLVIYSDNYDEIVEIYRQYIPTFGTFVEIETEGTDMKPSTIAPEIFIKKYSRNCKVMPEIVSEEDAKNYGKNIMKFPRDAPISGASHPSDGVNQHWYVCTDPDFPYPGLQVNKLGNNKDYPFVPCCFKVEQKTKDNGVYRHYFYGESLGGKDKKQQDLIRTDKFLDPDVYGVLPNNLEKLFQHIDSKPGYRYLRLGVQRNRSSFLNSVMVSLHEQTGMLELDSEDTIDRLRQIRKELTNRDVVSMCRQSVYEEDLESIIADISNMERYFDPKLYLQLLEGYFNCNIFLFNREQMILPYYTQGYYKKANSAPCVFIYEHMGSESDHATYPQCEPIVHWNTKKSDETRYVYSYTSSISKSVRGIFRMLRESYELDTRIDETVFPWNDSVRIESQYIDIYGKTRKLNVTYKGEVATILTSPMAPIAVPEGRGLHLTSSKTALCIFRVLGAEVKSQTLSQRVLKEINGVLGNVSITIPTNLESSLENVPLSNQGMHYPDSKTSAIGIFNRNKKLARYITEYVFWLFSRYAARKRINVIKDKDLARFAKKYITIISDFEYGEVPKRFSVQSGLMNNEKLVVTSPDMLKRLMYVLKMYTIRDLRSLMTYHERAVIVNYYMDITDFDRIPNQIILHGEDTIDRWIQENKFEYTLRDSIIIGNRIPYFFKNVLVEDRVFLAQNTDTLQKALDIAVSWQRKGYNIGQYAENSKKYRFTLYKYESNEQIVSHRVSGDRKPKSEIRILGYRLGGKPFYTALLALD